MTAKAPGDLNPSNDSAEETTAVLSFYPYHFKLDRQGNTIDTGPVHLVFVNTAGLGETLRHFQHHLRNWAGCHHARFLFEDHGIRLGQQSERCRGLGILEDTHVRFAQGQGTDPELGDYTLASAHRDQTVSCGHRGQDFDEIRNEIVAAFIAGGHRVDLVFVGNTDALEQCDGSAPSGDGIVFLVNIE